MTTTNETSTEHRVVRAPAVDSADAPGNTRHSAPVVPEVPVDHSGATETTSSEESETTSNSEHSPQAEAKEQPTVALLVPRNEKHSDKRITTSPSSEPTQRAAIDNAGGSPCSSAGAVASPAVSATAGDGAACPASSSYSQTTWADRVDSEEISPQHSPNNSCDGIWSPKPPSSHGLASMDSQTTCGQCQLLDHSSPSDIDVSSAARTLKKSRVGSPERVTAKSDFSDEKMYF